MQLYWAGKILHERAEAPEWETDSKQQLYTRSFTRRLTKNHWIEYISYGSVLVPKYLLFSNFDTFKYRFYTLSCRLYTSNCQLYTSNCRLFTLICRLYTSNCRLYTSSCRLYFNLSIIHFNLSMLKCIIHTLKFRIDNLKCLIDTSKGRNWIEKLKILMWH